MVARCGSKARCPEVPRWPWRRIRQVARYSESPESAYSSGRLITFASSVLRAITITAGELGSGFLLGAERTAGRTRSHRTVWDFADAVVKYERRVSLRKFEVPCAPVLSMKEIAYALALRASGSVVEVEHSHEVHAASSGMGRAHERVGVRVAARGRWVPRHPACACRAICWFQFCWPPSRNIGDWLARRRRCPWPNAKSGGIKTIPVVSENNSSSG